MSKQQISYFDANATTMMPNEVISFMQKWYNKGNPSADYESAQSCRAMMLSFRQYIASRCEFKLSEGEETCKTDPSYYRIIFTSCASESNNMILRSTVDSYIRENRAVPHIIISKIEHKSIIEACCFLQTFGMAEITEIAPDPLGFIKASDVQAAIKHNTCLISIMHANNETGAINNIREIGRIAHANNVPFHTDAVQTFGKAPIRPIEQNVDAFTVSFHKFYGCAGVGMLCIREAFLCGYKLHAYICGTQNYGLRGGTENVPGIGAGYAALRYAMKDRKTKNLHLTEVKRYIINGLRQTGVPCKTLREYIESESAATQTNGPALNEMEFVLISTAEEVYLPNTLMLSIVRRAPPEMCNVELKKYLESKGVIVSIGSACNTSSKYASHVVKAMNMDKKMKKGILRISYQDDITHADADRLINEIIKGVRMQLAAGQKMKTTF